MYSQYISSKILTSNFRFVDYTDPALGVSGPPAASTNTLTPVPSGTLDSLYYPPTTEIKYLMGGAGPYVEFETDSSLWRQPKDMDTLGKEETSAAYTRAHKYFLERADALRQLGWTDVVGVSTLINYLSSGAYIVAVT